MCIARLSAHAVRARKTRKSLRSEMSIASKYNLATSIIVDAEVNTKLQKDDKTFTKRKNFTKKAVMVCYFLIRITILLGILVLTLNNSLLRT